MKRALTVFAWFGLAALVCPAEELIHLRSGFLMRADSHTQQDSTVVFRVGSGTVEYPAGDIALIEVFPVAPPVSAALPATQNKNFSPQDLLAKAASDEAVNAAFVRSVAKVESAFKPDAVSLKGARGLMQLMPGTAASLGVDASQPDQNARGGAKYLRALLLQYHGNSALALAAYNAGPGAVARYGGVPPYAETRRYILSVTREFDSQQKLASNSKSP